MHKIFRARYFLVTVLLANTMISGCGNDPKLQSGQATSEQVVAEDAQNKASWREQYAYSMGFAAYQWAFPYMNMARLRYDWTNIPKELDVLPYAPVNHFFHVTQLTDASWRGGGENLVRKNGWFYSHAMGRGADYGDYFFRTVHQACRTGSP